VAESGVAFDAEFSVIVARWEDGRHAFWDSPDNEHGGGILRRSTLPCSDVVACHVDEARAATLRIAEALGHVGVLTVEFFADRDGPLVNEIAPRVHNSGHWTIEGAATSQFEQHVRAICGLTLGDASMRTPAAAMVNVLGTGESRGAALDGIPAALEVADAHLHLYDKGTVFERRKMGHVTALGGSVEDALARAREAHGHLSWAATPRPTKRG
jgi:5-(carboxyamino)imidazole ribonucleotide synthase